MSSGIQLPNQPGPATAGFKVSQSELAKCAAAKTALPASHSVLIQLLLAAKVQYLLTFIV